MDTPAPTTTTTPAKWRPISSRERRVLGVLAEKAKTTPDQYPLSLNGIVTGCNQKTNRYPLMELEPEQVEEVLDKLKQLGAVTEVQGSGRVSKYRHHLYDWLGVEKIELSVMTELLLRGAQTEGELRQRAGRMDSIPDLGALRTLLNSLQAKGLVLSITPEGRGHVISHALYEERELDKVKAEFTAQAQQAAHTSDDEPVAAPRATSSGGGGASAEIAGLKSEIADLRSQISQLRHEFNELKAALT